jgi:hypothetical protein
MSVRAHCALRNRPVQSLGWLLRSCDDTHPVTEHIHMLQYNGWQPVCHLPRTRVCVIQDVVSAAAAHSYLLWLPLCAPTWAELALQHAGHATHSPTHPPTQLCAWLKTVAQIFAAPVSRPASQPVSQSPLPVNALLVCCCTAALALTPPPPLPTHTCVFDAGHGLWSAWSPSNAGNRDFNRRVL